MEFQMHNVRSVTPETTEVLVAQGSGRLFADSAEGLKIAGDAVEVAA